VASFISNLDICYWHVADITLDARSVRFGVTRTLRRHALLFLSQSVCGGSPSSLSLAVSIAMRMSASVPVRFGLNASSS